MATHLESKKVQCSKSTQDLFHFLSKAENYTHIMPDNVEKFEADDSSFVFGLKGMPEVRLLIDELIEFSSIKLKAASSKLDFSLVCEISAIDDSNSNAQFIFDADFNMMIKMMVEKPLASFIDQLASKVESL